MFEIVLLPKMLKFIYLRDHVYDTSRGFFRRCSKSGLYGKRHLYSMNLERDPAKDDTRSYFGVFGPLLLIITVICLLCLWRSGCRLRFLAFIILPGIDLFTKRQFKSVGHLPKSNMVTWTSEFSWYLVFLVGVEWQYFVRTLWNV